MYLLYNAFYHIDNCPSSIMTIIYAIKWSIDQCNAILYDECFYDYGTVFVMSYCACFSLP